MKKIKYEIYSEGTMAAATPLIYKYSNTPNIEISVMKKGFFIVACRTVKKKNSEILSDPLFRDSIKKCCLIQLIKYGEISFKSIYVRVDGKEELVYNTENSPLIYGLCGNKLTTKMSLGWKEAQFNRIVRTCKSKENRIDASLYALIIAKSKIYETEKFIYLWMAMNGLYGYIAEKAAMYMEGKNEKGWIKKEYAQLKFMALFYGYNYRTLNTEDADAFRFQMELMIARKSSESVVHMNAQDMQQLQMNVEKVLEEYNLTDKMSVEAALLLYLPYLVRCKYFHSEKALPLLCFQGEHPLPVLRVLNQILEEFLDSNLYNWMNEQLLTDEFYPRIEAIAKSCKCDKNHHLRSCLFNGKERI